MVLGYHLIMTAYGWWLPNDPRGSMSQMIRNDVIGELGTLHFSRKRVQPASREIREFYDRARQTLQHELLQFSTADRVALSDAFGGTIRRERYTCYACAIMWDHVHLCIRKHKHQAEDMIARLQETSRALLFERGLRPAEHPTWGGPGWKVFIDTPDDFRRTVGYIEQNPTKANWPAQQFPFVSQYDGWPLHKHSIN